MATDARSTEAPDGEAFQSTSWTIVLAARTDSAQRRAALERLCRTYWPPVYGYLRRRGSSPTDAEDLTQSFFAELLKSDFLDRPHPDKGRFRGYLIGALRRHVGHTRTQAAAQKRGAGVIAIEWKLSEAEQRLAEIGEAAPGPDEAYERAWALAVLDRAMQRLEAEQASAGRAQQFVVLKPYLNGAPGHGDYVAVGEALGIPRTHVALQIHRLHRRYAELVRREVAETVADPAEVRSEMEHLRQALRR